MLAVSGRGGSGTGELYTQDRTRQDKTAGQGGHGGRVTLVDAGVVVTVRDSVVHLLPESNVCHPMVATIQFSPPTCLGNLKRGVSRGQVRPAAAPCRPLGWGRQRSPQGSGAPGSATSAGGSGHCRSAGRSGSATDGDPSGKQVDFWFVLLGHLKLHHVGSSPLQPDTVVELVTTGIAQLRVLLHKGPTYHWVRA